jgi:RimJ/RimL family protein N-acetyltransferase
MSDPLYVLRTARLGLRAWRESDLEPFVAMNSDAEVMRYFPVPWSRAQTVAFFDRLCRHHEQHGFCYFAVDRLDASPAAAPCWIGFVGLMHQDFAAPFTPCVDIGWRIDRAVWGHGYAVEAARACLEHAFTGERLPAVHAVAPRVNQPSIRVMQKLGMRWIEDFDHSKLQEYPALRRCVHYRIAAEEVCA